MMKVSSMPELRAPPSELRNRNGDEVFTTDEGLSLMRGASKLR